MNRSKSTIQIDISKKEMSVSDVIKLYEKIGIKTSEPQCILNGLSKTKSINPFLYFDERISRYSLNTSTN